jgi:peptidyl-prolyl cis-trans isomerase C
LGAHLEQLQSLIDKELLIAEARAESLETDREFLRKEHWERDQQIIAAFEQVQIADRIAISEEELRAFFASGGYDRLLKFGVWTFADSGEAGAEVTLDEREMQTLEEVDGVSPLTGSEGFYHRFDVHRDLQDRLFTLRKGEKVGPLRFRDRFVVARLLDERPASFERYRGMLRGRLFKERIAARRAVVLDSLWRRYSPRLQEEGLRRLIAEADIARQASDIDPSIVLYRFEGRNVTAGDLIDQVKNGKVFGLALTDSVQVVRFAGDAVIPHTLLLAEARQLGLDQAAEAELAQRKKGRMVDELVRRRVKRGVEVTYGEAKDFFDDHPETFRGWEQTEIDEILVETEADAQELLEQIRDGGDWNMLAKTHSLRNAAWENLGRIILPPHPVPPFKELVEAARTAQVGAAVGPLEVEGGYSIFRVIGRYRKPFSFDDKRVQFVVKNMVTRIEQNRRFDALVADLRRKYADQVFVYADNLERATAGLE